MASKVIAGSQVKCYVAGVLCGIFDSISAPRSIGTEAIHVLGSYGPVEITPTSYEAINVTCSGFRLVNQGANVLPKFPRLQDLLNLESISLVCIDRRTGIALATIEGCVATSEQEGYQAKSTSRISVSYQGLIKYVDGVNENDPGAVTLP